MGRQFTTARARPVLSARIRSCPPFDAARTIRIPGRDWLDRTNALFGKPEVGVKNSENAAVIFPEEQVEPLRRSSAAALAIGSGNVWHEPLVPAEPADATVTESSEALAAEPTRSATSPSVSGTRICA